LEEVSAAAAAAAADVVTCDDDGEEDSFKAVALFAEHFCASINLRTSAIREQCEGEGAGEVEVR
jgi:hypothetical protein